MALTLPLLVVLFVQGADAPPALWYVFVAMLVVGGGLSTVVSHGLQRRADRREPYEGQAR